MRSEYKVYLRHMPDFYVVIRAKTPAEAKLRVKRFLKNPETKIEAVEKFEDLQDKQRGPLPPKSNKPANVGWGVTGNTQLR